MVQQIDTVQQTESIFCDISDIFVTFIIDKRCCLPSNYNLSSVSRSSIIKNIA